MNLKQLEYIITIAEEKNITRAAEKLYITQSALNQQLLKIEKELETPLFIRSKRNWQITKVGEIYIENAKKILRIKKDAYNQINDLLERKKGRMKIGLTLERGPEMFSAIYPVFYKKYPHVKIESFEMSVKEQQREISEGNLDIGFLTLQDSQKKADEHIHICSEEIILAVPKSHPLARFGGKVGERLPKIGLVEFSNSLFAIMQQGSTLREIYDKIVIEENTCPDILLETRSCHNLFQMVAEGICCSVIPISYTRNTPDVVYFSIQQEPFWEICASYKKDTYLNHAARELIKIASQYWKDKLKPFHLK
ncbi:LysR family transcriptional regulator [Weizmannia sp. CD-2023]|uniref:Transcriptional regulator, LysR family n=1 Tax=Heyndrickxia coagulans TaxID=1398 RepID=A0A133L0B8_HEYCO|nr:MULTISPECIES: LysR family transcriptional regulator [Heyndrickxia]KGT37748.1 hypothetical protein P421_13540 [Heyndrickxia coagulans P38]KWZ85218.1 transcriptional regulator, LysR family [Heyndrickxia coagulans]MED4321496.1 LysR family transcriptional regulator [Weizmannia sp. CD-2023]